MLNTHKLTIDAVDNSLVGIFLGCHNHKDKFYGESLW